MLDFGLTLLAAVLHMATTETTLAFTVPSVVTVASSSSSSQPAQTGLASSSVSLHSQTSPPLHSGTSAAAHWSRATPAFSETDDRNSSDGSSTTSLSLTAQQVVIATTTIGGTLVLALLLYALWQRRQGASYSEIIRFRPGSKEDGLSSFPENGRLATLPIYRHERFSIRSSRHPSIANFKHQYKVAAVPAPIRADERTSKPLQSPPVSPVAIESAPSKPPSGRPNLKISLDNASPTQEVAMPEKVYRRSDQINTPDVVGLNLAPGGRQGHPHTSSYDLDNITESLSNSTVESPDAAAHSPHRWSWTNSQAPSTPRISAPNNRSSLASSRRRTVVSWMRNQGRPADERRGGGIKRNKPRSLLKNQAVRPVLAPAGADETTKSGRQRRMGYISPTFKSNFSLIAQQRSSQLTREKRPMVSSTIIEMTQKR